MLTEISKTLHVIYRIFEKCIYIQSKFIDRPTHIPNKSTHFLLSQTINVQVVTLFFQCVKHENNDMISNSKDLREETYDLTSDLKQGISTLQKKVDRLIIEFDNIDQYEHGDGLVIPGDIIPHGTPTENCKDIVLNTFWHHLNMNDEDE